MGKKSAVGLLSTLITAGVAVGVAKYLKDYAGVKFTDDEQIDKVKSDSSAVREAAKRTYIAIKEKSNFKEAATELSKAAGSVMTDAADIAKTAGNETMQAFKDMKTKYDEDPDAFKSEFGDNISDMTQNLVKATQDKTEEFVDRIKSAYNDFDVYEVENADGADTFENAEEGKAAAESEAEAAESSAGADSAGEQSAESAHAASTATADTSVNSEAHADEPAEHHDSLSESLTKEADNIEANYSKALEEAFARKNEAAVAPHAVPEHDVHHDDGSFKLNFVDDDESKAVGSNVTITDDEG